MNKSTLFYMIHLLLLSAVFYIEKAHADSSTAGNPVTVNRNSGFNALRNPALMSWQHDDSIGLGLIYSLQVFDDADGTISAGGPGVSVEIDNKSIFKGTALFSYIHREKNHSFGAGIRNADDSQYSVTASNTTIENSPEDIEEKNIKINVSSVFSYSYRFSNHQSIGIQAEGGFSKKNTEKKTANGSFYENKDEKIEAMSGTFSIGYSVIGRNFEAGSIINSGEFIREKINFSYKRNTALPDSGTEETGPRIFQDKGYGIIAGIGFRPVYNLLLHLEAGTQFPHEYEKKSIQDKNPFEVLDNEISSSGIYLVRCGMDYLVNRSFSAGTGVNYIHTAFKDQNSIGGKSDTKYNQVEVTSGVEYKLLNGINILFTCSLLFVSADISVEIPGPLVTNLEINSKTLNLNFATGVSMYF